MSPQQHRCFTDAVLTAAATSFGGTVVCRRRGLLTMPVAAEAWHAMRGLIFG
jgi:hypothetical protein